MDKDEAEGVVAEGYRLTAAGRAYVRWFRDRRASARTDSFGMAAFTGGWEYRGLEAALVCADTVRCTCACGNAARALEAELQRDVEPDRTEARS